jgi:hypothetical protein
MALEQPEPQGLAVQERQDRMGLPELSDWLV